MKTGPLFLTGIITNLVLLTGCSFAGHNQFEIQKNDPAVIGGSEMKEGDDLQKHIVAVYDNREGALCTGTLLANNVVITAAHCIGEDKDSMVVIFGNVLTEDIPQFKIDKTEVSPYWARQQFREIDQGDIALVHFVGRVPSGYEPATLITAATQKLLKKGTSLDVAGYGISDVATGDGAGTLRHTTLNIEKENFGSSELLLNQSAGTAICHGDSGGPAFLQVAGKSYFAGLASRGIMDPKDTCATFSAYTSAYYYRAWITRMATKLGISLTGSRL